MRPRPGLGKLIRRSFAESKHLGGVERRDVHAAENGLRLSSPDLSAGVPTWIWQKRALFGAATTLMLTAAISLAHALFALAAILAVPFFCVVALKSAALWHTASRLGQAAAHPEPEPGVLPRYSLLIPLYDEAAVVPDLISAIERIDYPADRLEVFLVLEDVDLHTRAAVGALTLPRHVSVVVVPDGRPRTKPRALNFALRRATGDLVVVYDAEDMPEPDQLRRAAARLAASPGLGCLQARLNVINDGETWLTRQFAIEYTALFDCLLPTLERLNLPVPLGGTSNHFSKAILEQVGGWDPFNVTEDADLGIRLARKGYRVEVLGSTTWEEAPADYRTWRNQRTRWLKGWMQTYLVHMRRPLATARDLGWLRFFGLQVLMGGLILSALVHPWFYAAAIWEAVAGPWAILEPGPVSNTVRVIACANLILGYVTGVALGAIAVAGRGRYRLAVSALLMPAYWLMISLAAYRALYQLATSPYDWEKTPHRPRAAFAPATPSA
jgi:cellulose synthase/poly-beta-1,6-N-acetylglucosamine synthase-like glycosyltransferase